MNGLAGQTYTDADGRAFAVTEHRPGAANGREVIGTVAREGVAPRPYACSAIIFQAIWVDHNVFTPPAVQEANSK